MTNGRMMKWRVRKENRYNAVEHEDVRRSLEVLDSVLAEFDDCLESWDNTAHDLGPSEDESYRIQKLTEISTNENSSVLYGSHSTDGSTSHDSGLSLQEQVKITSPPPIPKRSASTKLSDRNSGLFTFSDTHSYDSLSSDLGLQDNETNLSTNGAIVTLSAKVDDEVFRRENNNVKFHCCSKCGSEIDTKRNAMENKLEKDASSSPFSERRKMFENRIGESKTNVSPLLERSFTGSSFKVRADRTKDCQSEPSSLVFYKSYENDRSDSSHSSFASKYSPKATKVSPPRVDGLLPFPNNLQHAPNCNCKERLRQLQIKFAETRRLLKANKIRGVEAKPPSFVPPPPPVEVVSKNSRNDSQYFSKQLSNGLLRCAGISDSKRYSVSNGSLNSESIYSEISENSYTSLVPYSEKNQVNNITNSREQKVCDRCSNSEPLPIAETIEDIPKLRPTDALKRPHLGLSYCMEEDFIPGIKEILQTSTPRNGLSKNSKMTSLSTFSLSDSSLGYVSSQSDMEISNSPINMDKVPVSSIKFSTLPEGMDLHSLPSYYGHGEKAENERKSSQPLYRDRNFNHTTDPQLRSSSAPPPPENEKPKKKHFRGFSRKDKDKKKNEDNISVTSYLSLDDGMILKATDGDTNKRNAADSGETGVEKKRWSALRSILRKR